MSALSHASPCPTPFLRAEGLRRVYKNSAQRRANSEAPRAALDLGEHPFELFPGEVVGLMGHNGSGKSTLMRILALLESPDEGSLYMNGELVWSDETPRSLERHPRILEFRRQVTLLLQTPYLLSRSVAGNVAYGLDARAVPEPERSRRVNAALEAVGLDPAAFLTRRRNELSGGEAQRVALAARLAIRPQALLMDEPTSGVDEHSATLIANAVRHARAQGTGLIVVSHDAEWLTPLCDRLVRFKDGKPLITPASAPATPLQTA